MLKNIIWMVSGLALGLLIWAAYAQYKKVKDKKRRNTANGFTFLPVHRFP